MRLIVGFLFLSLIASPLLGAKNLFVKLVGAVDKRPLTSREVQANYFIDRLFYKDSKPSQVDIGTEEFNSAVNRLIVEIIVFEEAVNFGVATVSEQEVQADLKRIKGLIQSKPALRGKWQEFGYTDPQLKEMIDRKLRANKFIKYKSNSSYVQVSDDEAQEYFNRNRIKFGSVDFDSFRPNIKRFLAKKNAEDRLRDWFEVLRKKYKVKNLVGTNDLQPTLPLSDSK